MKTWLLLIVALLTASCDNVRDLRLLLSGYGAYSNMRYEEAAHFFGLMIEERPEDPAGYLRRGRCWLDLGAFDKALSDFARVTEIGAVPRDKVTVGAGIGIGMAYLGLKRYDDATLAAEDVLELDAKSGNAHLVRALALHGLGKLAESEQSYDTALTLDPEMVEAYYYRGELFDETGRPGLACRDWKRACREGVSKACRKVSFDGKALGLAL
jgi:tetratricopeptide (TPR) repeat protein